MRNVKKILGMAMVGLFAFVPFLNVSALTPYALEDWNTEGYGSATAVSENITNIKGNETATEGMFYGPFSKKSNAKIADGITEEVYVELNQDTMADREFFELTMSLDDTLENYVTEGVVMTQKVGDEYVLTAGWAPEFKVTITEDGVYTYRYSASLDEEGNTIFEFTILKWDEVIGTTGPINMGKTNADNIRSIWFCNVNVANGINVYTTLPEKPSEEIPVEPVEPTEPSDEVTTPDNTIEEQNPETSDNIVLTIGMLVTSLTLVGFGVRAIKKRA